MNKKFIFFKLSDHLEDDLEVFTFSQMELTALFGDVRPIDNIFQLMQQPEIKRVIEKEVRLQNALTDALANHGRHGYLWTGTDLPDVTRGLFRLSSVKEMYLFQQLLDSEPAYLKNPEKSIPFSVFNIYLWRVYRIWTRQFLFERGQYIRSLSQNEIEIDRQFSNLLSTLRSDSVIKNKYDLVHHAPTGSATFNQDHRPYTVHRDMKWLRALMNCLHPGDGGMVLNPFCGNGRLMLEALMVNQNVTGIDINPLQVKLAGSNIHTFEFSLPELSQAISDMISQLKMIVNESDSSQTDLFLYSTESKFMNFWRTEKERLKTLQHSLPDDGLLKYIAAARFIIESESVSRSAMVNQFLAAGLINVTAGLLRKKKEIDFVDEFQRKLRKLYLNIYLIFKIQSVYEKPQGKGRVQAGDVRELPDERPDAVVIDLPVRISKHGFEKDRATIELLNLHGASHSLEAKIFGSRTTDQREKELWAAHKQEQSGLYAILGDEALSVLQRLEKEGREDDAFRYYVLWSQYRRLIREAAGSLRVNGKFCIIAEHPVFKTDDTLHEIKLGEILRDMVHADREEYHFGAPQVFIREWSQANFGQGKRESILIFSRLPEEQDAGGNKEISPSGEV